MIEASKLLGVPQVFHVHDWQAALIPVYLRTVYAADPALSRAATVLTIHNAAYQGKFPPATTEQLLFPWEVFTMEKVEQFDRFNFLKGGVVFSDLADHREQEIRRGDTDQGVRRATGGRPAAARAPTCTGF